ncbi:hypothetical protein [Mammaliicoccus sp. N-M51]|uniref:hypothetical protein n=1 Tax=Mammaliicoccus sp. N-M51 TaxID=2898710 RepID=UPI001EFC0315|nr:hypothetical protein [Mammaliicoccus sp. N-M51]
MKKLFRFIVYLATWVAIITMVMLFKSQGGFDLLNHYVEDVKKQMKEKEVAIRTEQIKKMIKQMTVHLVITIKKVNVHFMYLKKD